MGIQKNKISEIMKNIVSEINSLDRFNSRLDKAKSRIIKLENKSQWKTPILKLKQKKGKKKKNRL